MKHLKDNHQICFSCDHHLQMNSQERIDSLLDYGTWHPLNEFISPGDLLQGNSYFSYTERLKKFQENTGLQDGIQTGNGLLNGIPIALGILDLYFLNGTVSSVSGEKLTRLIEYAIQEGLPLILISSSGGSRMEEGSVSLMQMAKISSALKLYQSCGNLLYLSILTSPTTGGSTASFSMLGDLTLSEPKALIGFAGQRLIRQNEVEKLPNLFQTAEYLLDHGFIDLIVSRFYLKEAITQILNLYKTPLFPNLSKSSFRIQKKLFLIDEEKIRRNLY